MKLQIPSTKLKRNPKLQTSNSQKWMRGLDLGSECFYGAWILVLGAFLLTGCLSRKPLHKETFAFPIPSETQTSIATNAPVLTLRQISIVAPFDSPSLTYRTGEFSYERDPYAGFLVSPAETLKPSLIALLRNSGKFSDVTDTDSSMRGNLEAEISVTKLYGDFSNKSQPFAALEMRFILFRSPEERGTRSQKIAFEKTYSRKAPLKAHTATAVVEGLNKALKQIVVDFANDVPAA